jgi:tol-pal system protein YbgF
MRSIKSVLFFALLILSSGCATPTDSYRQRPAPTRPLEQQLTRQNEQLQQLTTQIEQLVATVNTNQAELVALRSDIEQLKIKDPLPQDSATPATIKTQNRRANTDSTAKPTATQIYLQAFSAYTGNDYSTAITNFATFISDYPRNPYIPNAYYWLGESYWARGELQPALEAFMTIANEYATARKAPDALLKMAKIHAQRNQKSQAVAALAQLKQQYPDSSANKTVPTELLNALAQ